MGMAPAMPSVRVTTAPVRALRGAAGRPETARKEDMTDDVSRGALRIPDRTAPGPRAVEEQGSPLGAVGRCAGQRVLPRRFAGRPLHSSARSRAARRTRAVRRRRAAAASPRQRDGGCPGDAGRTRCQRVSSPCWRPQHRRSRRLSGSSAHGLAGGHSQVPHARSAGGLQAAPLPLRDRDGVRGAVHGCRSGVQHTARVETNCPVDQSHRPRP